MGITDNFGHPKGILGRLMLLTILDIRKGSWAG